MLVLAYILLIWLAGCEQRPIDVAPETSFGTWTEVYIPRNNTIYGRLSGSSASNIYGIADADRLIHYDGTAWSEVIGPDSRSLRALWVVSTNEVYAVGFSTVYRYDGTSWTPVYENGSSLHGIWGSSSSDIYVAAYTNIVHFDGAVWEVDSLETGSSITAVWGSGPSNVFALGRYGLILHNDGTGWSEIHRGSKILSDIWGSGPHDVYAVGGELLHYNGVDWSPVQLPSEGHYCRAVWGTDSDNVFVLCRIENGGILHFDGAEWDTMNCNTGMSLNSVWGAAPDDVYAVGECKKIIHYDGAEWSTVSGGIPSRANFLWGLDVDNLYLGNTKYLFHFDGTHFDELPNAPGGLGTFALWGTSASNIVSVGLGGKVFHFNGTEWVQRNGRTDAGLVAVSGAAADAIWAVGVDKTCIYFDGNTWRKIYEDVGEGAFYGIWAASGSSAFVVGSAGFLAQFNGVVWTFFDSGVEGDLLDVWGTSRSNVFAVGRDAILHFDGAVWEKMPLPPSSGYREFGAVAGTSANDVFAATYDKCYFFNGSVWSLIPRQADVDFADIWCSPDGLCLVLDSYSYYSKLYRYRW